MRSTLTDAGYQPKRVEMAPTDRVPFVIIENQGAKDYKFEGTELHTEEVTIKLGKSKRPEWTAPSCSVTFEAEDGKNHCGLETVVQ